MGRKDDATLKPSTRKEELADFPAPGTFDWFEAILAEFGSRVELTPEKHMELCEDLTRRPDVAEVQYYMLEKQGLEHVDGLLDRIMEPDPPAKVVRVRIARATRTMLAEHLSQFGLVVDRDNKGLTRFIDSLVTSGIESGKISPKWLSILDGLIESPTRKLQRRMEGDEENKQAAQTTHNQEISELTEEAEEEALADSGVGGGPEPKAPLQG